MNIEVKGYMYAYMYRHLKSLSRKIVIYTVEQART